MKRLCAAAMIAVTLCAAGSARAGSDRVPVDDPVLDRNGDGYQDVIVDRRKVHYDIDFDGRFDYTLVLKFAEYTSEGHRRYIASGLDSTVFAELTMEGLDTLCASDREKARWIEDNFSTYPFYHDGYAFLYLFSESPANDGRLLSPKEKGDYLYYVTFNPDGSVQKVRRGDVSVTVTEFDYKTNTNEGEKILLPGIEKAEDLEAIRSKLEKILAGEKES